MAGLYLLISAFIAVGSPQPVQLSSGPAMAEEVNTSVPVGSVIPSVQSAPPPFKPVYKGVPGIYPVYEMNGEWVMLDRKSDGRKRGVKPGSLVLVVGSGATALFRVARSMSALGAACSKTGPLGVPAYVLTGRAKKWVGIPIIAIPIATKVRIDPKKAGFFLLSNQVNNETYSALEKTLQDNIVSDITDGRFAINPDDTLGRTYAQNPNPENIHTNIDFEATLHMARVTTAQALVTLSQMSKSSRRCFWLFLNDKLAGRCAEMPHLLMAETNFLNFVSYDPNHDGHPFVLAYTTKGPMWGHERWGFHVTRRGPSVFLIDTLDPKCRERF